MAQLIPVIRLICLLFFQALFVELAIAQVNDTTRQPIDSSQRDISVKPAQVDSIAVSTRASQTGSLQGDSTLQQALNDTAWIVLATQYSAADFIRFAFAQNKFFGFSSQAVAVTTNRKEFKGKELLFYFLITLLLFFAFLRLSFPKYVIDLFRVAFRTTLKQRQIGEQLVQAPLPSLLFNFFFLISGSLYLDFVFRHYHWADNYNFWLLYFYCFAGLTLIYIIKFLTLKFSGWIFNISETTDAYIFIVFMINKIIGIYLLPFLSILAFTDNLVYLVGFTLSYFGVFALLGYRFILSYGLIRNQMRLNPFHFFLYLCAFEIVPLFLIYKALMLWF